MPYLIKVGLQPENDTKVTSKGYFISRSKSTVTVKFGNITVSNKRIKKFKWAGPNLPVIKMLDLNDEEAAKRSIPGDARRASDCRHDLPGSGI